MKTVSDIPLDAFKSQLRHEGVWLDLGLAVFRITTPLESVSSTLYQLYADYPVLENDAWYDFNIQIKSPALLRRFWRPQVSMFWDGYKPFLPLPLTQAYPLLEWGMNWCVANHIRQYLLLHAAVLEKNGKAILFPAPPGSGKSTLTAFLALSGWRLLTDEMAVIDLSDNTVHPFVRPICLKNNSITLVKEWFPDTFISKVAKDTNKGDVAHVQPPTNSVVGRHVSCEVASVVFPEFNQTSELEFELLSKADTVLRLIENAFNHDVLGQDGFTTVTQLVENSSAYSARYSDLTELERHLIGLVKE